MDKCARSDTAAADPLSHGLFAELEGLLQLHAPKHCSLQPDLLLSNHLHLDSVPNSHIGLRFRQITAKQENCKAEERD